MTDLKPLIIGIGGTLRPGSSTELAIRIALQAAERAGARVIMLSGNDLVLSMYNPEEATRPPASTRLVDLIRESDGLIIGSPGYHGSVSGLVKNALDYTEDLRDDTRPYLDHRAVGCIACAAGWQAVGSTLASLRAIVHALRGWPTPLAAGVNTTQRVFDPSGRCLDEGIALQLTTVGQQVVDFALAFRGAAISQGGKGGMRSKMPTLL